MITKAVSSYVIDQLISQNTPSVNFNHCLNKRQKKHKCTFCMDICPENAIKTVNLANKNWSSCTNCGLCAAQCPSRAIIYSENHLMTFMNALKDEQEKIIISCHIHDNKTFLKPICIGSLPWEYLATLAIKKKCILIHSKCDSCQNKVFVEKNIQMLKYFFGTSFDEHFVFSNDETLSQSRSISRRQLFHKASQKSALTLSSLMPDYKLTDGLMFRNLLNKTMQEKTDESFGWIVPMLSKTCRNCGICEKLCPHQALRFKEENKKVSVIFYPDRCTYCGQCSTACIHHEISGYGLVRVNSLDPVILAELEKPL